MHLHQLLLMKRGGQVIYSGPLGRNSHKVVEYFEVLTCVPLKIFLSLMVLPKCSI